MRDFPFRTHYGAEAEAPATRTLATEVPIAVEINGLGYAVMMATPQDFEDFGIGFALSERLIDRAEDVLDCDVHETPQGMILRLSLAAHLGERIEARIRHRVGESSCGLCGIENLEQALRPLPQVTAQCTATPAAIFAAQDSLPAFQRLNRLTGAVHGAALCGADGTILLVREDVGRHNAFDKLIGAMARSRMGWDGGFALLSARASFELVEKAVLAQCPLLAVISAPTSLAVERAAQAGLRLVVLARSDSYMESLTCG